MLSVVAQYVIVVLFALLAGGLSVVALRKNQQNIRWAVIPLLVVFIVGVLAARRNNNSESYMSGGNMNVAASGTGYNGSGGQIINVYQSCGACSQDPVVGPVYPPQPQPQPAGPSGSKSGPSGPTGSPAVVIIGKGLSAGVVDAWVRDVNPGLTDNCVNCVVGSVLKMWNVDALAKVQALAVDKQLLVLNALLAFDCSQQCVIPSPTDLNPTMVASWVQVVMPDAPASCKSCIVAQIIKQWTAKDYKAVVDKPRPEQINILQAILAFNCASCQTSPVLSPADVQAWISALLPQLSSDVSASSKAECMSCAVNALVRMWSPADFSKVKAMDQKSQTQVLQAVIAFGCEKQCVEIPSGLTPEAVAGWLSKVLAGESGDCMECAIKAIVRLWTPVMLQSVQSKKPMDQLRIVQGVISMNCQSSCSASVLAKDQILAWANQILPTASPQCLSCITDTASSSWSKSDFISVTAKPTSDQAKVARNLADYSCPDVCSNLEAFEYCEYMPY